MRANQAIKIERPNLSILQSLNQESFNQRITQATNQPIKKASARCGQFLRKTSQVSPLAGRRSEQPKNSNLKGRGFIVSASGIDRFPVVRSPANPEGSRSSGKLGLRERMDSPGPARTLRGRIDRR